MPKVWLSPCLANTSASYYGNRQRASSRLPIESAAVPTAKSMQGGGSNTANQRRWTVHMSNHFEIFHDGLSTDRVDEAARQAEAAYETLSAALKYETPGRVTLILVLDQARQRL